MIRSNWQIGEKGHTAEHNELSRRLQDVREFGAVAGVADCSAAFQAALPNISVPSGAFSFEHSVLAGQYLSLRGAGRQTTHLNGRGTEPILVISDGGFHIRDLFFFVNGQSAVQCNGVVVDGLLSNCWFNGNGTQDGLPLFSGSFVNITVTASVFEMASHAIKVSNYGEYIGISDCVFWDVANTVLEFVGCNGINLGNSFIEAKNIEDVTASAVVFRNCQNINLSNLIFSKVGNAPAEFFAHAIYFENCTGVNISNVITDNFSSGEPIVYA